MAAKKRKESNEEQQFEAWLIEAAAYGLIDDYDKQPHFKLIAGVSVDGRVLHRPHDFTADFVLHLTRKGEAALGGVFQKSNIVAPPKGYIYIDTKGAFMNRGTGQEFSINQKLVYERHGVWVAKVVPFIPAKKVTAKRKKEVPAKGLFAETWCPAACRWAKPQRKPAIGISEAGCAGCRTVAEFVARHEEEKV